MRKGSRIDWCSKLITLVFHTITITNPSNAQWVRTGRPSAGLTLAVAGNGSDLIAGTFGGGVFLSKDSGATWDNRNNGLTSTFVVSLAVVPDGAGGSNFFAATNGGGVFLSSNNGASWTAINNGFPNTFVHVLAATSGASGTVLFAGVDQGGAYLSTNNGANWNAVNTGLPVGASIFTLLSNGTNVFAGIDNGCVFRSSNNGSNWTEADSGLSGATVSMLTFRPNGNGTDLFAAMRSGGVFHSTNDGTNWTAINTGLTNTDVRVLSFFPSSGPGADIIAVTFDGDIWKRPLSEIVTSVENPEFGQPAQFNLEQNYPNPFNPSTKMGFWVQGSGSVSLKVYDVLGREVATLVNEKKVAGKYSVTWNASSMSSGVYFYRLQAGSFVETRKLVLLR